MGIKFKCEHCHRTLNVKDHLAGKRGICPKCQGKIEIPQASTDGDGNGSPDASTPSPTGSVSVQVAGRQGAIGSTVDPIAEAPQMNWYVAPPGSMTKYGPAPGDLMRSWIREGRVTGDSLVWREGWPQWRVAAQAFPELTRAPADAVAPAPRPEPGPAASTSSPPIGELDDIEDAFDGTIRAPQGIDIGVDDLTDPTLQVAPTTAPQEVAPPDSLAGALAPFDDEPETYRAPSRTAARYSGASRASTNAFLIAGLLITFIALVAVLIYLLTRNL